MINVISSHPLETYSVLMPLAPWEKPQIVAEALASLEAQTWPAAQVLVSCDGEPPSVLCDVLQLSQLPLQILVGPGGEGVGPVLARGLLHCHEELILRMDADDWSEPERAAVQVGFMLKNSKVKVMGTPINEFEVLPNYPLMQRHVPSNPEDIARVSLIRNPINHPSVILRKSAILAVGNYRSMPGFEDYDLWLRLLKTYGPQSLANGAQVLVCVRVGPEHLSRRRGCNYAISEAKFLWTCGIDRLIPWTYVISSMLFRLPLRLVPAKVLLVAMKRFSRSKAN